MMSNKNLLVITNNFPNKDDSYIGGIFVKEQLKHIKKQFNKIYVISPIAYGIEKLRKTKYENYSFDNVTVYFPKYFNVPFFYDHGKFGWRYFASRKIIKLIEKENLKFELIHAHFTWPSGNLAIACKEKFNVPVVITEHSSVTFNRAIEKKDKYFIWAWKSADAIIRVNKGDISKYNEVGIDAGKVIYIPNGFDVNKFYPLNVQNCKKKLRLPEDKKIILCVGNLYDKVKGHKFLVEASAKLISIRKDIFVIIIGEGHLKNELEKQIHGLGLNDYVKLIGSKPHDEIALWMNASDIFVLPSLNEGNPTVMFEILGCGKPFIGTNVGGIPEIIISNKYGLLVESANSEDLADKILSGLDMDWDEGAIIKYAMNYTWENIADEILKIYSEINY